jgi:hypothetical protein
MIGLTTVNALFTLLPLSCIITATVLVLATSAVRISDTLSHFRAPLFPFEAPPSGLPPPHPTSDRPSPQFDGLDLLGHQFIDPELGACIVIGPGAPVFLQPRTGNLGPDPLLPSGWHPTLRYRTIANRIESSSVTEVARWVVEYPPPTLPLVTCFSECSCLAPCGAHFSG